MAKAKFSIALWLCLAGYGLSCLPAQETLAGRITCCDELKIKQAMTEEALARILALAAPGLPGNRPGKDYLSEQAYEKIKKYLPADKSRDSLQAALQQLLKQPAPDADIKEFQTLVGHFVMGMSLEIANTLQDEHDQATLAVEKCGRLLGELETFPRLAGEDLNRSLFRANLSDRELRRILAMERKWKNAAPKASPLNEFIALKKNITGRSDEQDLWLVFEFAEYYRPQFPFLDEFLENYRRLGAEFLDLSRRLDDLLNGIGE